MKTHLHVVTENNPPPSAARERLRELLDQRTQIAARIADLQAANARLNGTLSRAAAAKSALAAFESDCANRMLQWSKSPGKDQPIVDSALKRALADEAATTADQAATAEVVRQQLALSIQGESAADEGLDIPIMLAVAEIISEVAGGALLEDLRTAVQTAVAKQERLRQAVQLIFTMARSSDDHTAAKGVFDEAGRLDALLKSAVAPPAPDGASAFAAWQRFVTELRSNPAAQLDPNS